MANEIEIVVRDKGTQQVTKNIDQLQHAAQRLNRTGVRVDVEANTTRAEAKLSSVERKAGHLDGDTAVVDVDAQTAAADTKLALTNREVSRVDGRRAEVNVDADVNGALAKIALVGAALAGIGAGGFALAGLGLGAAAAGGLGIGAVATGLSGVGDAVKQLGVKTAGAGGSARKAAQDHLAMASALDRVKTAEQQLASARLDAADAAREAQQRVADAARGVVTAQEREIGAQRDLTAARADARRELEDLAQATEDMALRQRDADLRVREAQENLAKVSRDRHSTGTDRDRAQLGLDEALQNQKDTAAAARQLAAEKTDADRKGVEGSDAVTAAQQRLRDAHEEVLQAQRDVAEAQRQGAISARHSAESIASAQQAVVEAQRGVQRAMQATGAAGGGGAAGVNKLQQAMDNLSPAGQRFARFLRGFLDGPIKDLRFAVQDGILPPLQHALEDASPEIERLTPKIGELSAEFGELLGKGIEMGMTLAPALLDLADAGLDGLQPLMPVLQTLTEDIAGVIEELINTGEINQLMKTFTDIIALGVQYLPDFLFLAADMAEQLGPEMIPLIAELLPLLVQLVYVSGPLLVGALKVTTAALRVLNWMLAGVPRDAAMAKNGIKSVGEMVVWMGHMLGSGVRAVYNFGKDIPRYLGNLRDWIGKVGHSMWDPITNGARDMYNDVVGWLDRMATKASNLGSTIYDNTIGALPGFAHGGVVGGGGYPWSGSHAAGGGPRSNMVMVGEHGRELVRLPFGSTVHSSPDTERLMGGGAGAPIPILLEVSDNDLGRFLAEVLRKYVRVRGGNVQVVLGRA